MHKSTLIAAVLGLAIGLSTNVAPILASNTQPVYSQYGTNVAKRYHCPEDAYKFINTVRPSRYFNGTQAQHVFCISTDSVARAQPY